MENKLLTEEDWRYVASEFIVSGRKGVRIESYLMQTDHVGMKLVWDEAWIRSFLVTNRFPIELRSRGGEIYFVRSDSNSK